MPARLPGLKLVKKSESSMRLMERIDKMRDKVISEHEASMNPKEAKETLMKIKAAIKEAKDEGVNIEEAEKIFLGVQETFRNKEFELAVKNARQALKVVNEERKKMKNHQQQAPDPGSAPATAATPEPAPPTQATMGVAEGSAAHTTIPASAPPAPAQTAGGYQTIPAPTATIPAQTAPAQAASSQGVVSQAPAVAAAQPAGTSPTAAAEGGPEEADAKKEAILMKKAEEELVTARAAVEKAKASGVDTSKAEKYLSLAPKASEERNFKKVILIARKAADAVG
jgi:hypothetical protein